MDDPARGLNLLREYVQAFVLRSLHECEAFTTVAFVGGTALRFLHQLPRFSEDLDFSLVDRRAYEPQRWLTKVRRDLTLAGFECSVTFNKKRTVNVSWVRIAGLLAPAGLAARKEHKLSIKLEIDTRPPAGALVERTVLVRHLTFALRHHSIDSLMAGKLHALITRRYPKGRDWFDLVWYRARRPPVEPRIALLQNALDQTQGAGRIDARRWRHLVRDRLARLDTDRLTRDVHPFLERPEDRLLLDRRNIASILRD
ncbi:MAG: nucleotidyl transferase AbiEii/AbiGii toxin family protein [Deltaproteobacteria bacterium]|nr:nucleotidyl transferase AbiEii/AbiGii toxin family protein [Deltaproteobacteria bacterium]